MLARLLRLGACLAASLALWAAPAAAQIYPTVPKDANVPSVERYLARCLSVPDFILHYHNTAIRNKMLDGLTYTKASMVGGVFAFWDDPCKFNMDTLSRVSNPSHYAMYELRRLVRCINTAYDDKGLRRPILQASIFEHITEPIKYSDGVQNITIPQDLLELFRDEIEGLSFSERAHYMLGTQMRTDVPFEFGRLSFAYETPPTHRYWYSPDATQIEGRLWLCYEAKCLIEQGITSLHIGQAGIWAKLYTVQSPDSIQAHMRWVASVTDHIHQYAENRTVTPINPNKFVLLAAEMSSNVVNGRYDYNKYYYGQKNGHDRLLVDFTMPPLRPIDVIPPNVEFNCTTSSTQCGALGGCLEQRDESYPPCADGNAPDVEIPPLPECRSPWELATLDPCHARGMMPNGGGGESPLGHVYDSETPRLACFDIWDGAFESRCDYLRWSS